jgi:hypothetical protein
MRGNRNGGIKERGTLYLRIPPVVQVCRKVSGKAQAYEVYVPLPPDPTDAKKGSILQLNSLVKLETLCYTVGDVAMFMPEADLQDVDIVKKWHDDPKLRVTDFDEAVERLTEYIQSRGDEEVDVDVYGPATEAGQREQEAKEAEKRRAERAKVRTVKLDTAFEMAHVVVEYPASGEETSVSAPTLSGASQAASHPNVKHLTDTLVRMGYLEDLQKGVFVLADPLGTKHMGRRNRIAKHIKSKADAQEAMLVLCREGKMVLLSQGLFRVPHFDDNEEPLGQARVSSGSSDHQPFKKKPKSVQAKPKVRKSVSSEPAKAANLYDAKEPQVASSVGRVASNSGCKLGNMST